MPQTPQLRLLGLAPELLQLILEHMLLCDIAEPTLSQCKEAVYTSWNFMCCSQRLHQLRSIQWLMLALKARYYQEDTGKIWWDVFLKSYHDYSLAGLKPTRAYIVLQQFICNIDETLELHVQLNALSAVMSGHATVFVRLLLCHPMLACTPFVVRFSESCLAELRILEASDVDPQDAFRPVAIGLCLQEERELVFDDDEEIFVDPLENHSSHSSSLDVLDDFDASLRDLCMRVPDTIGIGRAYTLCDVCWFMHRYRLHPARGELYDGNERLRRPLFSDVLVNFLRMYGMYE